MHGRGQSFVFSLIALTAALRLCLGSATAQAQPQQDAAPTCTIQVPVEQTAIVHPVHQGDLHLGNLRISIGSWHNRKNRFQGRPVVVTLDLGEAYPVRNIRLDCNPPNKWHTVEHAKLEASIDGQTWEPVTETKGPGPTKDVGAVPFELSAEVGKRFRFVRAVVMPQAFYVLTINHLDVVLDPEAEVRKGMRELARDRAFYEPDGPIDERWAEEGFWGEKWRNFDPSVPRVGGPGACVKAYFHNRTDGPLAIQGLTLNGVSVDEHLHVAADHHLRQVASLWIDPDEESEGFQVLVKAGEPVWYKAEPDPVPPNGVTEVTLRLRAQPDQPVSLDLVTDRGELAATATPARPHLDVLYLRPMLGRPERPPRPDPTRRRGTGGAGAGIPVEVAVDRG